MAGEYEELFADLDRQFRELKANHEVVVAERDQLRTTLGTCEEQRAALTAEVKTLTTRLDEAAAAARRMELAANSAKQERDSFASAADIKQGEIDRLNEELRQRNERVAAAMEREGKTFAELSKAQAEVRPLQLQVARLQEERDLLARQRQELEQEAQRQQAALLEQRRAAAAEKVRTRARATGRVHAMAAGVACVNVCPRVVVWAEVAARSLEAPYLTACWTTALHSLPRTFVARRCDSTHILIMTQPTHRSRLPMLSLELPSSALLPHVHRRRT